MTDDRPHWDLDALFYVSSVGDRMNWRVSLGGAPPIIDVWMPLSQLPEQRIVNALRFALLPVLIGDQP